MDSVKRRSLALWTGVALLLASAWLIVGALASRLASWWGWRLTILLGLILLATGVFVLIRFASRRGSSTI
ncbi:MAG TPA: hypothetical protein VJ803_07365 [Gemmatimonadaceae bacterium]|nr:hypothetical protein [Gemmatimonadaceae bacterium]